MALLTLRDVTAGFGGPPLLVEVSLVIDAGERIALVGSNGVGKSTLLGVLEGHLVPDSGKIQLAPDLRMACLPQTVPSDMQGLVFEIVARGLGDIGDAVATHYRFTHRPPENQDEKHALQRSERILHETEAWQLSRQVEAVISRLDLDPDTQVAPLSAGMRRRVLLGRALVQEPDLLLLDEPTNHLDLDSIRWLEGFLSSYRGAILFITHDRFFLEAIATRIVSLDRGRLTSYSCGWKKFLEREQEALAAETRAESVFDKKLAEEEIWIRKGVKERRKRNMGRVRELQKLRSERRARRARMGSVRMVAQEAERTGRLVIDAIEVSFSYGCRSIVQMFSATVQRGDRVGILGPNGCGKTTLLRILLGELEASSGIVRHGTNIQIGYFDQLHSSLELDKTVQKNVSPNSDTVLMGGRPRHIVGYLQDFLFSPIQARSLVRTLSGGERNRVLLARLFSQPTNVLVLDEPTNDLDVETLDLLEELLLEYKGTVLVVSHDRAFLDNVVTSTFVFERQGIVKEYVGGYSDWLRQRREIQPVPSQRKATRVDGGRSPLEDRPRRLTYLERQELEKLPDRLEALEARKQEIHDLMSQAEFYTKGRSTIDEVTRGLASLEQELSKAYERWEQLEELGE